jgi:hypothetical protein
MNSSTASSGPKAIERLIPCAAARRRAPDGAADEPRAAGLQHDELLLGGAQMVDVRKRLVDEALDPVLAQHGGDRVEGVMRAADRLLGARQHPAEGQPAVRDHRVAVA